jgi:hypothetical protein
MWRLSGNPIPILKFHIREGARPVKRAPGRGYNPSTVTFSG